MNLIDKLRQQRIRLGLSQQAVAQAMGTTQSALARAERGGNPTQNFLQRYREALVELGGESSVQPSKKQMRIDAVALKQLIVHLKHLERDVEQYDSADLESKRVCANSAAMELVLAQQQAKMMSDAAKSKALGTWGAWLAKTSGQWVSERENLDEQAVIEDMRTTIPQIIEHCEAAASAV